MDIFKDAFEWGWLIPIIYDVAIRLFPTTKDWTILNKIVDVVEYVFPNRRSGGGKIRMKRERESKY